MSCQRIVESGQHSFFGADGGGDLSTGPSRIVGLADGGSCALRRLPAVAFQIEFSLAGRRWRGGGVDQIPGPLERVPIRSPMREWLRKLLFQRGAVAVFFANG